MVFVENSNFFSSVVFGEIKLKKCFLDQKIKVLKSAKKWTFSKEVDLSFLSKNQTFSYLCFLHKIMSEKIVLLIFWIKKNDFKTRKLNF